MRRKLVPWLGTTLALSLLLNGGARAERYALLVGVGQYGPDSGLNALCYAEKDVEELSRLLQSSGYRKGNVMVMTKSEFDQRRDVRYLPLAKNVRGELELLLKDLDQRDDVLVALAGHGVKYKDGQKSFFCPIDAKLDTRQNLIALEDIYAMLRDSRAGRKLLLCDACRNDPFKAGSRTPQSVTRPETPPPPGGVAALYACSAGERAWEHEDLGHGVFFYFVLEGLRGKADLDEDKAVGMLELAAYVPKRVKDYVRSAYRARQMPDFQCRVQDFPLVEITNEEITNSIGMKLKLIPAGEFLMGSAKSPQEIVRLFDLDEDDAKYFTDEHPQHRVRITKPFYLGMHEVTVGQFRQFVEAEGYKTEPERDGKGGYGWNESEGELEGRDPKYTWRNAGFAQTDTHPVVNVTWNDAVAFCKWLSDKEGLRYRLPTEAEWEYACRGGTTTMYYHGDDPEGLALVDNVADASAKRTLTNYPNWPYIKADDAHVFTAPVGCFRPNAFGLYDMQGNVLEWCADRYDSDYYEDSPTDDPAGPTTGSSRVIRGGSWRYRAGLCRSAFRFHYSPGFRNIFLGFRVASVPVDASGR